MIEEGFLKRIKHSMCINGIEECSDCNAFKIDDDDGIANYLGFTNSMLSKVDYFAKNGHIVQLIELTDLENDIRNCNFNIAEEIKKAEEFKGKNLTAKEKKSIKKQAWSKITNELKSKWSGSIAIIERLYRKNLVTNDNPEYQLLIVCKNYTDIRMLDHLKIQLQGMMNTVCICKTSTISSDIISAH